jgi:CheY-like chemotaxis protein
LHAGDGSAVTLGVQPGRRIVVATGVQSDHQQRHTHRSPDFSEPLGSIVGILHGRLDGRIDERIFDEYTALNLRYPPSFFHANSAKRAVKILENDKIDLIITWLDIGNTQTFEASKQIKEDFPKIPIMALSHYSSLLRRKLEKEKAEKLARGEKVEAEKSIEELEKEIDAENEQDVGDDGED